MLLNQRYNAWVLTPGIFSTVQAARSPVNKLNKRIRRWVLLLRVIAREFRGFFLVLGTVFLVSTCILHHLYPADASGHLLSWTQTAYYTWLMIFFESPLAYVEHPVIAPLFFVLPLIGLITIAEGVVHLGNLLFQHKRYSREWQKMIAETFEEHVVVCGLGNVGIRVVQHLRKFDELVVAIELEENARFIHEVAGDDVPVLIGDARDSKVLENANVSRAKAIIAVTDNDLCNLEVVLTAREYNPKIRVVMRMFDQKLAKKVEKFLGIDAAYSSSARSARVFAQSAISENILDSFEFGGAVINAYQLTIEANSQLVGETVDDVRYKHEVTVLLHETANGHLDWNPSPSNSLSVGDKLLIMTDREGLRRLQVTAKKLQLPKS